jgi:prepilin-type N-terminal cleavage/methylation domain-containing protein
MIELKPIEESKLLSHYGYDPGLRVLALRFNKSAYVWHYINVPPEIAAGLEAAKSKGAYFCAHIKHEFESIRINTEDGDDPVPEPTVPAHAGYTLIEMLITVAIGLILLVVGISALKGNSNVSWGINGVTESRCISGYQFVIGEGGQARQVLDEFGKGVRCKLT